MALFTIQLVNTATDQVIDADVTEGESLDVGAVADGQLSLIAVPLDPEVEIGSVVFSLSGPVSVTRTENVAEYVLFGNNGSDYKDGPTLPLGDYTLTVTAYSGKNGGGQVLDTAQTVAFTLADDGEVPPDPEPADDLFTLQLIDADSDQPVDAAIEDGETIDISAVDPGDLTLVAAPVDGAPAIGSVRFELSGPTSLTKIENVAPYALFGDKAGDFRSGAGLPEGEYTLTVTAFVGRNGQGGAIGEAQTLSFTLGAEDPEPQPEPETPADAAAAFEDPEVQALIDTSDPSSGVGRATLAITPGNNVQASNFGADSFVLSNTGDKRIAAVYLDVSDAVFQDAVFDPDGRGGDNATKPLTYSTLTGDASAIDPNSYDYVREAVRGDSFDPTAPFDPNALDDVDNLFVDETSNRANASPRAGGGYEGTLLLFDAFGSGGSAGFAIDMDPNSVAGYTKNALIADSETAGNVTGQGVPKDFDIGGVSGAELIGSKVTILFGDGSTATGVLVSDGTQSGAIAVIDETVDLAVETAPGLTVNGVAAGGSGTYGGTRPSIVVTGDPGDVVRVTMVKALDPTGSQTQVAGGQITIDEVVAARLAAQFPEFPVNNAVEWQVIDVTIPAGGSVDLTNGFGGASFDYNEIDDAITGADDFDGDDVLPLAFTAHKIDGSGAPVSDLSSPIYLLNQGGPVDDDAPPPDVTPPGEGAFQGVSTADSYYYKVQFESASGPAPVGQAAPGDWSVATTPDADGRQAGFEGAGYLIYGDVESNAIDGVREVNKLDYQIYVPEAQTGRYELFVRASRDGAFEGDQQNDVWVAVYNAAGEQISVGGLDAEDVDDGYVKMVGGSPNGGWEQTERIAGGGDALIDLDGPGIYTISFSGRSEGYHLDSFLLVKSSGEKPAEGSEIDSAFNDTGLDTPIDPIDPATDSDLFDFVVSAATTGETVDSNLEDGDVIALGDGKLKFVGTFAPGVSAASVQMELISPLGIVKSKIDNSEAFTFTSNANKIGAGDYTLRLRTYDENDAGGDALDQQLITFTIEDTPI